MFAPLPHGPCWSRYQTWKLQAEPGGNVGGGCRKGGFPAEASSGIEQRLPFHLGPLGQEIEIREPDQGEAFVVVLELHVRCEVEETRGRVESRIARPGPKPIEARGPSIGVVSHERPVEVDGDVPSHPAHVEPRMTDGAREPRSHLGSALPVAEGCEGALGARHLLGRDPEVEIAHRTKRCARVKVSREIGALQENGAHPSRGESRRKHIECFEKQEVPRRALVVGLLENRGRSRRITEVEEGRDALGRGRRGVEIEALERREQSFHRGHGHGFAQPARSTVSSA